MANFVLYDLKENWDNLLPFTFTRPVSEIRVGILTIKEKWERYLEQEVSYRTEAYLQEKFPAHYEASNIFINSALMPDKSLANRIKALKSGQALIKGDDTFLAVNCSETEIDHINQSDLQCFEICECKRSISFIQNSWDIFQKNPEQIESDFELLTEHIESQGLSETNRVLGEHPVFLEEGASVECAILNATEGPIYIGKNAVVMEGATIRGPFALCHNSQIKMGAKIYEGTTIGPHSKVGGEVSNSVIFGYSNKAHDGFLGNAVLGEWCNLGADSNNSNLKNNYENVKVWSYVQKSFISTRTQFCGLFMGDHSKCGINTMFNTGTTVGISCNIYGAGFPRTFIPSFSWGGAQGTKEYKLDKVFRAAELVMERRHVEFTETDKNILTEIFERTQEFRH